MIFVLLINVKMLLKCQQLLALNTYEPDKYNICEFVKQEKSLLLFFFRIYFLLLVNFMFSWVKHERVL